MWFRALYHSLKRHPGNRGRRTSRRPAAPRLQLEALEDRTLPSFYAPISYAADTSPDAVVTADFNRDDVLDLAVANYGSNTVSVLLGNGDGSFQAATNYDTGANPRSLAVGDLDGDGKPDLATANETSGDVTVLLGNGAGAFGAPGSVPIPVPSAPVDPPLSVAVGDLNKDGKMDLVVTSQATQTGGSGGYWGPYGWYPGSYYSVTNGYVHVLLGTGGGNFAAPNTTPLSSGAPVGLAVADLDGDGWLDVATANEDTGTVSVLLNNRSGALGSPANYNTGWYPRAVAVGDFTGDGKPDLATAGQTVDILPGLGNGTFQGVVRAYIDPTSLAAADFNGDGKLDVVTAEPSTGAVSVLLGKGDGTLTLPVDFTAGSAPTAVVAGDFNGDGRPDVATSEVTVLLNDAIWPALDAPSITIDDVTVTEGNTGAVSAVFTVRLSAAYGQTVSVHYGTADDSATIAEDYQAANGTVTFAPGETSKTVSVLVNGDRRYEDSEFFNVYLSDPTNAFVADDTGVGTILNDEPYFYLGGDVSGLEGNTGTTSFAFTVALSAAYDAPVTVGYATADGSATAAGGDYQAASGTLTFAPGETSKTISVLVNGDRLGEADEFFWVNLSDPSSMPFSSSPALGTILNDEPTISINGASAVEGNTGTTAFTFTVTLSAASDAPVSVSYATADGTATVAGGDYQATSGTLTFAPGETSKTLAVLVNGDRVGEPNTWFFYNEEFYVNLNQAVGAIIGNYQGVGTILEDEPRIGINDVQIIEGNSGTTPFAFRVALSVAYDVPLTVNFATYNGSASAGSDYQTASGTLTIAAGQTTGTITVLANGDRLGEANETFFVTLSNLNYGGIGITNGVITHGVGTILDDEPRISISDVSKVEGKKGQTTLFTFTVTLSAPYDQPVTVSFKTTDGTATTRDNDYVAKTGTLTFAPGETSKTITIVVNGDNKKEASETFYLDLFDNSSNSWFAKNRGRGTILNDDP